MKWTFLGHLRDYCSNCTLAGVSYIADKNLHIAERLFWLVCVLLSAVGAYSLISEYRKNFDRQAVSIVIESVNPHEPVKFPTISVCISMDKYDIDEKLEDYVYSLGNSRDEKDYNYQIESHILYLVHPSDYHDGVVRTRCLKLETCGNGCAKCPHGDLRNIAMRFSHNCSDVFVNCTLARKPFDCCRYFQPLITPIGKCFIINSLQNNKPGSKNWHDMQVLRRPGEAEMKLVFQRPVMVSVLNEEDIPHVALPGVSISIEKAGQHRMFQVYEESMINDNDVHDIAPEFRKCRFPEELLDDTAYKAYSFSTCFSDCIRRHQMNICNCTLYTLVPFESSKYQECDLSGLLCLERSSMINPDAKSLLPWANSNYTCECLPSCKENEIHSIYESASTFINSKNQRSVDIVMPALPAEQFRRQSLRTKLDVVVTIGGIMGLFMGASILSAIEFIYFFTLRIYSEIRRA